jgi:hypothetical protein
MALGTKKLNCRNSARHKYTIFEAIGSKLPLHQNATWRGIVATACVGCSGANNKKQAKK